MNRFDLHQDGGADARRRVRRHPAGKAIVLAIFLAVVVSSTRARSAPIEEGALELSPYPGGPSDPAEVKVFLDQLISPQLEKHHIPGAVVVVVKDGEILYAGGYGYADLERQLPFIPDQTLFRIGSTAKLFTWTAVMQLVEQGRIDLDADLNNYLKDFQIPATYPRAITMRHLMSHSAGFEDGMIGAIASGPEQMIGLDEYVKNHLQPRARPPGELTAYSNYGATLAGYVVEVVSGLPFDSYVESKIYGPLGMESSTFRQPLPEGLADRLAVSYDYAGDFRPVPMMYINQVPAGAMSTTATDLARFMIAHLQDGRYEAARILQEGTARQMHARLFSNDLRLSGMAYGFFDQEINGQRVLHHGGGFPAYMGMLALLPEQGSGFYVGYNALGGNAAVSEFTAAYFDHYYPGTAADLAVPRYDPSSRAGAFAGTYRFTRLSRTTLESLANLTELGYINVREESEDGVILSAVTSAGYQTIRGTKVGPLLFTSSDGRERFAFGGVHDGIATQLYLNNSPHVAYERIAWYDLPSIRLKILAVSLLILLSFPVVAGLRHVMARRRGIIRDSSARLPEAAAAGLAIAAVLVIIATVGSLWINAMGQGQGLHATLVHGLGWLCVFLSLLVMLCAVGVWIRSSWSPLQRIHYTLLTVAAPGLLSCLDFWKVIDLPL